MLVRVFYALGDGTTPFRLSVAGIGLNVIFDWLLVGGPTPWGPQSPLNFGAQGLVLATVAINTLTCAALLLMLQRRLQDLPLKDWAFDAAKLTLAAVLAGLLSWLVSMALPWTGTLLGLFLQVSGSGAAGLLLFLWLGTLLKSPEVQLIGKAVLQRVSRR